MVTRVRNVLMYVYRLKYLTIWCIVLDIQRTIPLSKNLINLRALAQIHKLSFMNMLLLKQKSRHIIKSSLRDFLECFTLTGSCWEMPLLLHYLLNFLLRLASQNLDLLCSVHGIGLCSSMGYELDQTPHLYFQILRKTELHKQSLLILNRYTVFFIKYLHYKWLVSVLIFLKVTKDAFIWSKNTCDSYPIANSSKLVFPTRTAPWSNSFCTTVALNGGT